MELDRTTGQYDPVESTRSDAAVIAASVVDAAEFSSIFVTTRTRWTAAG
jgi:hypothetical protein